MEEDLQLIENIRLNERYLGVVFEQQKKSCLNFMRRKNFNNFLTPEELSIIYADSVYDFYINIIKEDFILTGQISTFLKAICKNKFSNFIRDKKRRSVTVEVDNFDNLINQIPDEFEEEPNNRLVSALEKMMNSPGVCYELLYKSYYQGYTNSDLNEHFGFQSLDVTKTTKYRCKETLKGIALKFNY
jgi:DNA-directed RNA polymerase specialized sigma24 family protein